MGKLKTQTADHHYAAMINIVVDSLYNKLSIFNMGDLYIVENAWILTGSSFIALVTNEYF